MLARLGDMMGPVCATAEIQVVLGERAMPADGLTIAGFTESIPHLYVVATHSGITLAPLLGKLVAREVNGSKQPVLNPFRPTRFATIKPITPPTHARTAGAQ